MKKYISSSLIITVLLLSVFSMQAQDKKTITAKFWVAGICGLCEETIEKTMDTRGVISADYNLQTNMLTVIYNSKKTSEDQLHKLLNEAGYDTEKSICTEEQYNKVHVCCRYREQEKH